MVAQLAARHDLAVSLTASPDGGLTALVALPGVLVGIEAAAPIELPVVEPVPVAESADVERPAEGLPRREVASVDEPDPEPAVAEAAADDVVVVPPALALVPEPEDEPQPEPEMFWDRPSEAVAPASPEPGSPNAPSIPSTPAAPIAFGAAFAAELLSSKNDAVEPEPEPAPVPEAPAAPVVAAPVGFATPEVVTGAGDEPPVPPTSATPRIGIGTFADLRATPQPRVARPEPEPAPEAPAARRAGSARRARAAGGAAGTRSGCRVRRGRECRRKRDRSGGDCSGPDVGVRRGLPAAEAAQARPSQLEAVDTVDAREAGAAGCSSACADGRGTPDADTSASCRPARSVAGRTRARSARGTGRAALPAGWSRDGERQRHSRGARLRRRRARQYRRRPVRILRRFPGRGRTGP